MRRLGGLEREIRVYCVDSPEFRKSAFTERGEFLSFDWGEGWVMEGGSTRSLE